MKLSLLLSKLADNDATQFITNIAGIQFKPVSKDISLVFHAESEEELISRLTNNLSANSVVVLYALAGTFHTQGRSAEDFTRNIQSVFTR